MRSKTFFIQWEAKLKSSNEKQNFFHPMRSKTKIIQWEAKLFSSNEKQNSFHPMRSKTFFIQWEAKLKPVTPCMHDFSHALNKLQVIVKNSDWCNAMFAPVGIDQSIFILVLVFWQSPENSFSALVHYSAM